MFRVADPDPGFKVGSGSVYGRPIRNRLKHPYSKFRDFRDERIRLKFVVTMDPDTNPPWDSFNPWG